MKHAKILGIACVFVMLASVVSAWSGIPPTNLLFYGQAGVNGTDVQINDTIDAYEGTTDQLVQVSVTSAGWYPALSIPWDDPDTGGDEGLTYGYPISISFKINGEWVEYTTSASGSITDDLWDGTKGYIRVNNNGIEGTPTKVDLDHTPNTPPTIYAYNQAVTQGNTLNFNVNATDDTTYRTDTLTISQSGSPAVTLTNNVGTSVLVANASWTPSCSDVCGSPYNAKGFSVADDGRPPLSDSTTITITVNNINDAPNLGNGQRTVLINTPTSINLNSALGYSDCDACIGDTSTFTIVSNPTPGPGTNLTITNASAGTAEFISDTVGVYQFTINVSDTAGAWDTGILTVSVTTVDVVLIKTISAISLREYEVTDIVINVNNQSLDFTNIELTDDDFAGNYTFNISYRERKEFTENVSLTGDGIVAFAVAELYNPSLNATYYSNEPSVFIGGAGGGGRTVERIIIKEPKKCGDGVCSSDEHCLNCPEDCGECPGCEPCVIVVEGYETPAEIGIPPGEEEPMPQVKIPWGILVALTALGAGGLAAWLMAKETLLVVSSRNLVRGPLTEQVLKNMLRERKLDGKYNVKSAGILAHTGHTPSQKMMQTAEKLGVDLSNFQTNAVTEKDIKKASKILVLDPKQKDFIIDHILQKNKRDLESKMHVLDVKPPKNANITSYRKSFKDIKNSLEERFSEMMGLKGEGKGVPNPKGKK